MKLVKHTGKTPEAPLTKPFKPENFFERMKEFENATMRRAYELFAPGFFAPALGWENLFREEPQFAPVPIDVTETEEGLVVRVEVPGFKEKEIELRVEPERLYVGGKREEMTEEKKGKTVYSERTYDQIARWIELPTEIVPDKVKATLNKGLLEITLHKTQPAKRVLIEVKAA
jgi:HSP20 family molecular chaperone IbpA